jgi:hypothetical protein
MATWTQVQAIVQLLQQNQPYWFYAEEINTRLSLNMQIKDLVSVLLALYSAGVLDFQVAGNVNIKDIIQTAALKQKGIGGNAPIFRFV